MSSRLLAGILWLTGLAASNGRAQTIEPAAEAVRRAFASHRFDDLLAGSGSVLLQLPSEGVGPRLSAQAAAAALGNLVRRSREVGVTIQGVRQLESQYGYVELRRQFRAVGISQDRSQRVLMALRVVNGAWRVIEVMILDDEGPSLKATGLR